MQFSVQAYAKKKKLKIKIQGEQKLAWIVDNSLEHCHFFVATVTYAAPHRRHFIQAFEIALFSVRCVQTHSCFWFCFYKPFGL
jgi:hypothetical protein